MEMVVNLTARLMCHKMDSFAGGIFSNSYLYAAPEERCQNHSISWWQEKLRSAERRCWKEQALSNALRAKRVLPRKCNGTAMDSYLSIQKQ